MSDSKRPVGGEVRLETARREQLELVPTHIDGLDVSDHTLSDFRVAHGSALDALLTQILTVLMHQDLVSLERTTQDGLKVRASAGSSSFHRKPSLERCRKEAEEQLDRLKRELESAPQDAARKAARKEAAARDLLARVDLAIAEIPKVAELKKRRNPADARASTTDPEARVMRMADGGFRPAYNVQLTTDTKSRVVASVRVTNKPADFGLMKPSLDDLRKRTGRTPRQHLVDGGYSAMKDIEHLAARGIAVFAPLQPPKNPQRDRYEPRAGQSRAIARWRRRMGSSRGQEIYKLRASIAETVNADLRCFRGLDRFLVRTLPKVTCVVLWSVIAYDLMRLFRLTT